MKFCWTYLLCAGVFLLEFTEMSSAVRLPATTVKRSTCSPDTRAEYDRRMQDLLCETSLLQALNKEIKQSNCSHAFAYEAIYDDSDNVPCDPPRDERKNLQNCSDICSLRVFLYHYCTTVGDENRELSRECGERNFCTHNNEDFCLNYLFNSTEPVTDKCIIIDSTSDFLSDDYSADYSIDCSDECRETVETFAEESGCCAAYFAESGSSYDDFPTIGDIFSKCGVMVPGACAMPPPPPPSAFLDCARDVPVRDAGGARGGAAKSLVMITTIICLIIVYTTIMSEH